MRIATVFMALIAGGCSAPEAAAKTDYEEAIACEAVTGLVAAFFPNLTRPEVEGLTRSYLAYRKEASSVGARVGKSEGEVEQDRTAAVLAIQERLRSTEAREEARANLRQASECVRALG